MAHNRYNVQHRIEEQDVVRMNSNVKRKGRPMGLPLDSLGVIEKIGGQDDDNQDEDPLDVNSVRVKWWRGVMESYTSAVKIENLTLVDRSFGPGDIVSRYKDSGSQMGSVQGMLLQVDAYLLKSQAVMPQLNAKQLAPIHPFGRQPVVVDLCPGPSSADQDHWNYRAMGHILACEWDLIVLFKDGSRCIVANAQADEIISDEIIDALDDDVPFWPGQAVVDPRNRVFKDCPYINGSWKKSHFTQGGRVQYIIPTRVQVQLLTYTSEIKELLNNCDDQKTESEDIDFVTWVHPSQFIMYDTFSHCGLRLAELALFVQEANKTAGPFCTVIPRNAVRMYGPPFQVNNPKAVMAIQERCAFYTERLAELGDEPGIIPFEEQVAWVVNIKTEIDVLWQDGKMETGIHSCELYSRQYVQDFDMFPGDIIRHAPGGVLDDQHSRLGVVQSMNAAQRTARVRWIGALDGSGDDEISGYDLLPAVKEDMLAGDLVLHIPSGSTVRSVRLAFHPELDSELPTEVSIRLLDSAPSAADHLADIAVPGQLVKMGLDGLGTVMWMDGSVTQVDRLQLVSLPDPESDDDSSDSEDWDSDDSEEAELEPEAQEAAAQEELSTLINAVQGANNCAETSSHTTSSSLRYQMASTLDISEEPFTAHHYSDTPGLRTSKALLRRLQEEWETLQKGLPSHGVLVKVSTHNVQLMKVLITGASFTPYAHALFAFDVLLPNDFPNVPPEMRFLSYGVRLNPNLSHKDGSICLSLLNTWHSPYRQEMWSTGCSILQILLSLQSLVLCAEPYYNEGAYDKHVGAERNSRSYNEQIVLNKVQYLTAVCKHPMADWRKEVYDYLRQSIPELMQSLEAYKVSDSPVSAGCDSEGLFQPPSSGFLCTLQRLLPELCEAFQAMVPEL